MASDGNKRHWSRHLDQRLVKFMERRRWLWDSSHPKHSSTALRKKAYEAFSTRHCPQFSMDSVKERWCNIRSSFNMYRRRVERSADKLYEPKWHLWKACQYLLQVKKEHHSESLDKEIKTEVFSDFEVNPNLLLKAGEEANTDSDSNDEESRDPFEEKLSCNDVVNGLVSAFQNIQYGYYGVGSEFTKVGRLINKKLSKMNSFEAAVASKKIMEILLLYDELNPDNPNNVDVKIGYDEIHINDTFEN